MLNAKLLKEYLAMCPDDMEITGINGEPIVHIVNTSNNRVILSDEKPIGNHIKCGDYVYSGDVSPYKGVCPTCCENLYSFEILTS